MNLKGKSTLERLSNIMRVKNYSENTISTYIHYASEFLGNFNNDIYHISQKSAIEFMCLKKYSSNAVQNQYISSVKLLYKYIIGVILRDFKIERPRKCEYLPDILSQEEIKLVINSICNIKHKCIISTIYYFGLRVSECINLKYQDFDKARKSLHIRQSKNNKDRNIPFQIPWMDIANKYFIKYKPKEYLFEGQNGKYSKTSIRNILNKALKNCNINKRITIHCLRHSAASHLLENGVDLCIIQEFLGHENYSSTLIYTKITAKCLEKVVLY